MPNFEFHGGVPLSNDVILKKMRDYFTDAPYASEVVTTLPADTERTHSLDGNLQPFVRVVGSREYLEKHFPDIRQRLKPFDLDVEVLVIEEFIAKDKL